jgi:transcriptional regulator with XRE-family HTH domain
MATRKRVDARLAGDREAQAIAATLGAQAAATRRSLRLRQVTVAARCGISRGRLGDLERGRGDGAPLGLWVALGLVLGRPLRVEFSRRVDSETADAGHLAIQELVLRLGRAAGYRRGFEVPTRPSDSARSTDVGLRDDRRRILVLVECWNTIGDLGAAARATNRKLAETAELAIAGGGERPFTVRGVWVVRATARNRALLARYPEIFAARFPGSSAQWVAALTKGTDPPAEPGLVWCDVPATRLFAWRRYAPDMLRQDV